jgi:hypothetical protein
MLVGDLSGVELHLVIVVVDSAQASKADLVAERVGLASCRKTSPIVSRDPWAIQVRWHRSATVAAG